jgi:hypothetical protein
VVAIALLLTGVNTRPADYAWVRYTMCGIVVVQWLCNKISAVFGDLANHQPPLFWVRPRTGVPAVARDVTMKASFVMTSDQAIAVIAALAWIGACRLTIPNVDLAPDTRIWWR